MLSVCICDTGSGQDLWINDYLCQEGYAEFEEQIVTQQPSLETPPPTPPSPTPETIQQTQVIKVTKKCRITSQNLHTPQLLKLHS